MRRIFRSILCVHPYLGCCAILGKNTKLQGAIHRQAHNLKVPGSNPGPATLWHPKGCLFLRKPPYIGLEPGTWRLLVRFLNGHIRFPTRTKDRQAYRTISIQCGLRPGPTKGDGRMGPLHAVRYFSGRIAICIIRGNPRVHSMTSAFERATAESDPHQTKSDAELAASAQADPAALAALYRRYLGRIYRYLHGRVSTSSDAEELTTQVFIEMMESLHRYEERGSFAAWLFTIARRRLIAHYREPPPEVALDGHLPVTNPRTDPVTEAIKIDDLDRLKRLLVDLKPDQREALELRYAGSLSYRAIGTVLNKSEAACKMMVHRALAHLREKWTDDHGEE
jgi:RNA polymerase sigma-70 factor (ECF subfamily)